MPGSATMDPEVLIDDLALLADDLRQDLAVGFGLRQIRLFTVLRTWTSGEVGDGSYIDVETEITPRPAVNAYQDNIMSNLDPGGLTEEGMVLITEVSLTYTEEELTGGDLGDGQEWLLRFRDGHGQLLLDRDFVMMSPPFPSRDEDLGWNMRLKRRESRDQ